MIFTPPRGQHLKPDFYVGLILLLAVVPSSEYFREDKAEKGMLCGYMHETDSSCIIHVPQLKAAQSTAHGVGKKSPPQCVHGNCQMTSSLLNQTQFCLQVKGISVFVVIDV